jgi:putative ABC transport system permease protein
VAAVPQNIPRVSTIQLDGVVLGFTLLLSLATGIIFGLVPAWQASHVDLNTALKSGTRGAGGVEGKHRVRNALVMTEVALALILLICASLLIQSFTRLGRVDTGMRTERLFTARIGLPATAYPKPENIISFFDQLMPRLRAIPGVESVTTTWPLPLSGSNNVSSFDIEENPAPEGQQPDSPMRIVGPDYFKTMGIPVRQGRGFEATDQFKSLPVVVVNEQFVRKFFPGQTAIVGKHIKPSWSIGDEKALMRTIVGVVGNVKHRTLKWSLRRRFICRRRKSRWIRCRSWRARASPIPRPSLPRSVPNSLPLIAIFRWCACGFLTNTSRVRWLGHASMRCCFRFLPAPH